MGLFDRRRESKGSRVIEARTEIEDLLDLQAPPFGLGFRREAYDMVTGSTPAGRRYRRFRYSYSGGLYRFDSSVVVVDLPFELPDVFWGTASRPRAGMEAAGRLGCLQYQSLRVWSAEERVAQALLKGVGEPTQELARLTHDPVDLSVDRNHLVAVEAPVDADLVPYLAGLDRIVDELQRVAPRRLEMQHYLSRFGFYGRPDWTYAAESDRSQLRELGLPQRPYARFEDLISCERNGVRMKAFRHTWLSEAAAKAPVGRGMVRDTDRESEAVCAFILDSGLPEHSVNGEPLGEPVHLGNHRFAEAFNLRGTDLQQTYHLFNEQVQEWMLAERPYGWTSRGRVIRFQVPTHDAVLVGECEDTLRGWQERVPWDARPLRRLAKSS